MNAYQNVTLQEEGGVARQNLAKGPTQTYTLIRQGIHFALDHSFPH